MGHNPISAATMNSIKNNKTWNISDHRLYCWAQNNQNKSHLGPPKNNLFTHLRYSRLEEKNCYVKIMFLPQKVQIASEWLTSPLQASDTFDLQPNIITWCDCNWYIQAPASKHVLVKNCPCCCFKFQPFLAATFKLSQSHHWALIDYANIIMSLFT